MGVYFLPILIAEKGLDKASITALSDSVLRRGTFVRDLPGPDYRLYLTPKYVETGAGFQNIKAQSIQIGLVKAFENFSLKLPDGVDATNYRAVLIWCEAFEQFITAAKLR